VANPEGSPFIRAHPLIRAVKCSGRQASHDGKPLALERVFAPFQTLSMKEMKLLETVGHLKNETKNDG
jgi:hypothetical protein